LKRTIKSGERPGLTRYLAEIRSRAEQFSQFP
jgi:hypothetical protein